MKEVIHTLLEAFVLVVLVVFLFLGNIRATLIPMIAVPVSLIGTFAVLLALGFSAPTPSRSSPWFSPSASSSTTRSWWSRASSTRSRRPRFRPRTRRRRRWARSRRRSSPSRSCCCRCSCPSASFRASPASSTSNSPSPCRSRCCCRRINALTLSPALCAVLLKRAHRPSRHHGAYIPGHRRRARRLWPRRRRSGRAKPCSESCSSASPALAAYFFNAKTPKGFLPEEDQGAFFIELQAAGRLDRRPDHRAPPSRSRSHRARPAGRRRRDDGDRLQPAQRPRAIQQRVHDRPAEAVRGAHRSRDPRRCADASRQGRDASACAKRSSRPSICRPSSA